MLKLRPYCRWYGHFRGHNTYNFIMPKGGQTIKQIHKKTLTYAVLTKVGRRKTLLVIPYANK